MAHHWCGVAPLLQQLASAAPDSTCDAWSCLPAQPPTAPGPACQRSPVQHVGQEASNLSVRLAAGAQAHHGCWREAVGSTLVHISSHNIINHDPCHPARIALHNATSGTSALAAHLHL